MNVCVIGGTGTLGYHVLPLLLADPRIKRIRILSRGEHRQMEMEDSLQAIYGQARVDFLVGDVRDAERVGRATEGCDVVYHFAAVKSVDKAEYDPEEAIKTNITGTQNVVKACVQNRVSKAILTSTDKAVAPVNLYGATKLVAEKYFIAGNIGNHRTRFSVCRYGNVLGSQGSVLFKWRKAVLEKAPIKVTSPDMTRYWIPAFKAAQFVVSCQEKMAGGEVFIPIMKSATMKELSEAFCDTFDHPRKQIRLMDVRPGEKLHESLVSFDEAPFVTQVEDFLVRWPSAHLFPFQKKGAPVEKEMNSGNCEKFSKEELMEMIYEFKTGTACSTRSPIPQEKEHRQGHRDEDSNDPCWGNYSPGQEVRSRYHQAISN